MFVVRRVANKNLPPQTARPALRQAGFTLIEVLVAALLLSIGLVGLAGLQGASLMNNQRSFMRSQVTALAYDLADRSNRIPVHCLASPILHLGVRSIHAAPSRTNDVQSTCVPLNTYGAHLLAAQRYLSVERRERRKATTLRTAGPNETAAPMKTRYKASLMRPW